MTETPESSTFESVRVPRKRLFAQGGSSSRMPPPGSALLLVLCVASTSLHVALAQECLPGFTGKCRHGETLFPTLRVHGQFTHFLLPPHGTPPAEATLQQDLARDYTHSAHIKGAIPKTGTVGTFSCHFAFGAFLTEELQRNALAPEGVGRGPVSRIRRSVAPIHAPL